MRKIYVSLLTVLFFLFSTLISNAQLTGVKNIPGDYATISAAVTALNAQGVGAGGVTFNVAAGHTETITGVISLTATGTAADQIIFQKSGVGANPLITAYAGGANTPGSAAHDDIWRLVGSDYVTIDGIDLTDPNVTIGTVMEGGYVLYKASLSDGAQNNTIKNCTITLNRINNATGSGPSVEGSRGIEVTNSIPTAATTSLTPTAAVGTNSNNKFYSNTIQNCNYGIVLSGYAASTPFTTGDTGNDVGGSSPATGNTILNYGGAASASNPAAGIRANNQWEVNISYNTINNNNGSGVNHPNTLRGIYAQAGTSANANINNNTITVKSAATTSASTAIENVIGSTAAGNTVNINNNIIQNCTYTTATTGTFTGILNGATAATVNMNGNTITNNTIGNTGVASSCTFQGIYSSSTVTNLFANNNTITNNSINNQGGTIYCIRASTAIYTVNGNIINNNSIPSSGGTVSGIIYGYYNFSSPTGETIQNNQINNLTITGNTTSTGNIIMGIQTNTAAGFKNWSGNEIHTLTFSNSSTGTAVVNGMSSLLSTTVNIYKNKIHNLSAAGSTSLVSGILIGSTSATATVTIYNNLIGNLNAPTGSNGTTDNIRGINLTLATTNNLTRVYYNTIYLSATSTGTNFSSSGIYHTTSATATTANLTLRNNLIINKSTPNGTGIASAYRRSTTALNNYNAASDDNLFYGGTPASNQLIFYDGTNSISDLAAYKTHVSGIPADQNSVTEDVIFQSTTGSSPDFLKFTTATITLAEAGAEEIVGITDDYAGTIRQGNPGYTGTALKPDIGAWELNGAQPACTGTPAASNTVATPTSACAGINIEMSLSQVYVGVSYQWQSSPDNVTYGDIPSANGPVYSTIASVTTWYQCKITCNGNTVISTPIQVIVNPQMNGTYTINNTLPTSGNNFISFYDAIEALNCRGISGAVLFNVSAGQTFTESSDLLLTIQGTAVNTVTFQKSGAGANPKIVRGGTSGTSDFVVRLNGADYITFDGIDFEQSGSAAADWVEFGIYLTNASATNGASNNTFKNGVVSLSNSITTSRCVYINAAVTPTAVSGTNSNNRFLNMTVQNAFIGYRFTGITNTYPDNGNEVNTEGGGSSFIQNLGDGITGADVYGMFATYQAGLKVSNTTVSNLVNAATGFTCGLNGQTATSNSIEFSNNTVYNLVSANASAYGIQISSGSSFTVFNNTIHTISTTGTASGARGIIASATGLTSTIYGNKIYNISSSGITTTVAAGIEVGTGDVHNVYNNMISDLRAPASTNTSGGTKGIMTSGTTAGQIVRIYYNTVSLSDNGSIAAYNSAGFHNSSTTPVIDFRNNIIINNSTSTSGKIVAFWKSGTTINQDAATNNNLYYAGTPGPNNLVYYDGTNAAETMIDIQTIAGLSPREAVSVSENVVFAPIVNGIMRPDPTVFTLVESSGQVIAGYAADFENTARGAYPLAGQANGGGIAPDLGADEGDFKYILPIVPNCPTLDEPLNATTGICTSDNLTLKWTPAGTGGIVTLGYDVFFGTSPTPPLLTNTASFSHTVSSLLPNTTYYWKIVPKNSVGSATGCSVFSFTTTNFAITSTTPATRCGPGTVTLQAAGSGGGFFNWFASPVGGNLVGTGASFTTPVINANTTYYVASASAPTIDTVTVGAGATTSATYSNPFYSLWSNTHNQHLIRASELTAAGMGAGDIIQLGLNITAAGTLPMIDFSLKIGSTGASDMTTYVPSSGLTTVYTSPSLMPVSGLNMIKFTSPFAWDGISNIVIEICHGNPSSTATMSRTALADNTSYVSSIHTHKTSSTGGSAQCGDNTTNLTTYSLRPQFTFKMDVCSSPRSAVLATVNTPPAVSASATNPTICEGTSTQLNATSGNAGYTYVWNPGALAGANPIVSPITSTTYTVTATDNSGGANNGCVNTTTVNVNVNPAPSPITVTPSSAEFCSAAPAQLLTSSGGVVTGGVALSENFNGAASGWTMVNNSVGGTAADADWTLRPDGYIYGSTPVTFHSNDNSQFIMSNSDAQGSGSTYTNTDLISPVFSLTGFTNPVLSFYHYYRDISATQPNDSTTVFISTNGGSSWTQLRMYNATLGGPTGFVQESIDLTAFAGSNNVKLKFNFYGVWDWYWAIDNLAVIGDQPATITWSPTTNLFTDAAATIPYTGGNATSVYALPVSNQTYTVTATNTYSCIRTSTATITMVAPPSATISYSGSPYCNSGSATVTRTGSAGGTYTSTAGLTINSSTGEVNLGSSTPGTYTVTYTVAAANGCPQFQTTTSITIQAAPSASISYPGSPYCNGGGSASVTFSGSSGGTYSSTAGLSINATTGAIDLAASTVGTYTVTYTIAAGACPQYQTTASVTITNSPSATISYAGTPYCSNGATATVTQTGSGGGTYSSTAGLSINASTGAVDIATSTPGTYTVTYSIVAAGGCSAFQTTTSITINTMPSATISYAGTPYCNSAGTATVTRTGTAGGTYSSTAGLSINSSTGAINLASSTAGTYTVTYTIAAGSGCPQVQTTTSITIIAAATATISYTGSPYCSNAGTATVTRTGAAGGTYSSTAGLSIDASTGAVTLATSTPGTYTVTYTLAAGGGCPQFQATTSITVTVGPSATISYSGSPYCSNGGTANVAHTGSTGGTYTSTAGLSINTTTGAINLGASTAGSYTITYTVAAGGGCPQYQTTASVTITAAPSATISYVGTPYCSNAGTATISRTGTAGGTYSSTAGLNINASTGAVTLATSTPGSYIVTYTVAGANGCAQLQVTTPIVITAAPAATISYAGSPYCSNAGTASVTRTGTAGGTYSSSAGLSIDASTGAVNLAASTVGTYTVTYTIAAANGCIQVQSTASITISTAPAATISYAGSPFCMTGGTINVVQSGTTGGTYSSTAGLTINPSTGAITLGTSSAGTYTVTYTVAASGGCAQYQATTSVTIAGAGTWLGTINSDWNNAGNWCGGIPTSAIDVVIPSVAPNMPNLSAGNGAVRNLAINNGATVTIGAGGVLDLYGNISGAGTFNPTAGSISFRGTLPQTVPAFTATNVTLNGAGGVTPAGNTTITGNLLLVNGNYTLGSNNVTLNNTSIGSVTSHIITNGAGNVIVANLAASQSRSVPVASDATSYNPVVLGANAGHTTDNITVRVQQGVYENGVSGTTFTTHVANRMWIINESTVGGSNVNVTLQWAASQELSSFDRTLCYVMQHNGTSWVQGNSTAAFGADPYTQIKNNVTSFSPFAVQTEPIPRPITGIYPNPVRTYMYVVTDLLSTGPVVFSVFDAKGSLVYKRTETMTVGLHQTRLELGHLSSGVYSIRVTTRLNDKFLSQKFVKVN